MWSAPKEPGFVKTGQQSAVAAGWANSARVINPQGFLKLGRKICFLKPFRPARHCGGTQAPGFGTIQRTRWKINVNPVNQLIDRLTPSGRSN